MSSRNMKNSISNLCLDSSLMFRVDVVQSTSGLSLSIVISIIDTRYNYFEITWIKYPGANIPPTTATHCICIWICIGGENCWSHFEGTPENGKLQYWQYCCHFQLKNAYVFFNGIILSSTFLILLIHIYVFTFFQYFAPNWPWYSLRDLHIRITWFSLYGIRIPLFSLYGIHMPLLPYMVVQPIVLGMALLWAAMDSSLSQGPLLWRHNDMTVIVSRNTRGRERDTQQRLDNANARRLQTVNR